MPLTTCPAPPASPQLEKASKKGKGGGAAAAAGSKRKSGADFTKSAKVFNMIMAHQDGSVAAAKAAEASAAAPRASHLKL